MEALFYKVNNNSSFMLYKTLIEECIFEREQDSTSTVYKYYTQLKKIDKKVLFEANLAVMEALEFFFDNIEISFEGKGKKYKKNFLRMLERLCNHKILCDFNCNGKVTVSIDEKLNELDVRYTGEKLCERKNNWLAIANIEDLKQVPLNRLQYRFEEYKNKNIPLDSQVEFVLGSYLKNIKVLDSYKNDLQNWKHQIVVFGKTDYPLFERDFLQLDNEVLDYFDYLMTKRVQVDLRRDDIKAKVFLDENNQIVLNVSKQYFKQKKKNI